MTIKTMIIVFVTILLTIVLMQNTGTIKLTFLFGNVYMSKLVVLAGFTITGLIIGILIGRGKKQKYNIGGYHDAINQKDADTLSDEDREYIS